MTPGEVQDLMLAFNKAIIERAMSAEMSMHLGYKPGEPKPAEQSNERNGVSGKTVDHRPRPGAGRIATRPRWQLRSDSDPEA